MSVGYLIWKWREEGNVADQNKRWKDCIGEDLRERGLREEDVGDRALWRRLARNSDPI